MVSTLNARQRVATSSARLNSSLSISMTSSGLSTRHSGVNDTTSANTMDTESNASECAGGTGARCIELPGRGKAPRAAFSSATDLHPRLRGHSAERARRPGAVSTVAMCGGKTSATSEFDRSSCACDRTASTADPSASKTASSADASAGSATARAASGVLGASRRSAGGVTSVDVPVGAATTGQGMEFLAPLSVTHGLLAALATRGASISHCGAS